MLRFRFLGVAVDPLSCGGAVGEFGVVNDREFRGFAVFHPFDAGVEHVERGDDRVFRVGKNVSHFGPPRRGIPTLLTLEDTSMSVKQNNALKSVRAGYDFDTADFDPGVDCSGFVNLETGEWVETPSLTRQADAADADINVMMARYQEPELIPYRNGRAPDYGDYSSVASFQEALNIVRNSEKDFSVLPAAVREKFRNNPADMLAFVNDPANRDEAVRLGMLRQAEPPAAPLEVRVVNEGSGEASPPKPPAGA